MSKRLAAGIVLAVLNGMVLQGQLRPERLVAERHPALYERAGRGDASAVLELGRTGDPLTIPYLRELAARPRRDYGTVASAARMALARLGVREYWNEIAAELRSDDPLVQDQAVEKHAYVGTPEAIEGLVGMLDQREYRTSRQHPNDDDPRREGTLVFSPLYRLALRWLPLAVANPPEGLRYADEDVQIVIWRQWWRAQRAPRR